MLPDVDVLPAVVEEEEDTVFLSTTNATGEREVKVAVMVPLPAFDSTFSYFFAVLS